MGFRQRIIDLHTGAFEARLEVLTATLASAISSEEFSADVLEFTLGGVPVPGVLIEDVLVIASADHNLHVVLPTGKTVEFCSADDLGAILQESLATEQEWADAKVKWSQFRTVRRNVVFSNTIVPDV